MVLAARRGRGADAAGVREGGARRELAAEGRLGAGVCICFICEDALAIYREVTSRGLKAARPFVGNGMWVTSLTDPDGYRLDFVSYTDVAEETVYVEGEEG